MKRLLSILNAVISIGSGEIAAWILFLMMAIVVVDVFARYVFAFSLLISVELSGYMLVAITFIGLGHTWAKKGHVRITFAIELLPAKARNWLRVVVVVIAIAFTAVFARASYNLVTESLRFGDRSEQWLRTPQVWPQLALLVGSIVLLLALICDLVETIRAARISKGEAS